MSDNSDNEPIEDNLEVPLTKSKKPRSQAQIEAFEKVKEKRRQNLEAKKQEKILNSAKLILEEETKKKSEKLPSKKKVKHVEPEPEPEPESESEEEVIVVKKAKPIKKQKKVRKIIIEESSSEEEEEEESEYEQEPPPVKRNQRKSVVRVIRPNPNDFFC
jgi:hypothetical protein